MNKRRKRWGSFQPLFWGPFSVHPKHRPLGEEEEGSEATEDTERRLQKRRQVGLAPIKSAWYRT